MLKARSSPQSGPRFEYGYRTADQIFDPIRGKTGIQAPRRQHHERSSERQREDTRGKEMEPGKVLDCLSYCRYYRNYILDTYRVVLNLILHTQFPEKSTSWPGYHQIVFKN